MKTQEFLNLLKEYQGKSLLFQYAPNLLVGANYHITEVKHITVDSVDCGAGVDAWKETIIQLWEDPNELGKTEFMSAYKAMAILSRVGKLKPYVIDAEVKIEYSNANFHTAQLFVNDYEIRGTNLMFKLASIPTDCKAKEACGIQPENVIKAQGSCAPGSGCC
ncbi:hypothetical protein EAX61_03365 [Dokdonia sinensis]|uniref:Uncharacterized protein n=1 Tax=Dokdonia sinensis TaxID=2479847 RepID=A0A3M0GP42_9FLAO|nr:DUF6428 family protein [Dokdonia sinensis]RMB63443.1 hypothetical protein EAX61_03365 [Dokdonia sinensis]